MSGSYQTNFSDMESNENGKDGGSTQPSQRAGGGGGGEKSGGCHVSTLAGFFLILLVLVLVAGVALVVFFATSRDLTCKLEPEGRTGTGTGTGGSSALKDVDEVVTSCKGWVENGGIVAQNICIVCPPATTHPINPYTTTTKDTSNGMMTTTTISTMTTTSTVDKMNYRLPGNVQPYHYEVKIQPDIYGNDSTSFFFGGSGTIRVKCLNATDRISLHVDGLTISDDNIYVHHENSPAKNLFSSSSHDQARGMLHLQLSSPLTVGQSYVLGFSNVTGPLRANDRAGLYLRSYRDGQRTVYLVRSQAEPVYFRKIFPSFDEPQLKATFDVILVRRNDTKRHYVSLSNSPLMSTAYKRDVYGNVWAEDTFKTTPRISTYMLSFTVCDFESLENDTGRNVTFRTFVRPNEIHWAQSVHEHGIELFEWMDQRFKPPYEQVSSSFDNVAIPEEKYIGMKMMKPGSSKDAMFYEPNVTSADYQLQVTFLTAHKIVHTWFGTYVSPKSWSYSWLEHALTTWWSIFGVEQVLPKWQMTDLWLSTNVRSAMESDAMMTSLPLNHDVDKSPDVTALSDDVTSTKGAAIMRMMQFVMGKDTFLDGLNMYLQNNLFKNTDPSDLFAALDKKMPNYMSMKRDSWISQPGYPVVMVTRTATGYQLTQKRFLIGPEGGDDSQYQWEIPLLFSTNQNTTTAKSRDDIVWLSKNKDLTITAPVSESDSWILVNINQMTYCRVLYDNATWHALIGQLNRAPMVIPAINRGQIIDDAWTFAKAGKLEVSVALATLDFLKSERDLVPWTSFSTHMRYLEMMLDSTELFPLLQTYIRNTLQRPLQRITLNIDSTTTPSSVVLKQLLADYACRYEFTECVTLAKRLFSFWRISGTNDINVNLRRQYYCSAVAEGDVTDWEFAYTHYKSADVNTQESADLRHALSCSKDLTQLRKLLAMALDSSKVRTQDLQSTVQSVSANPLGRQLAFRFLLDNWDTLLHRMGTTQLGHLLMGVTSHFNTEYQLLQLEQLPRFLNVSNMKEVMERVVNRTRENIAWLKTNYDVIKVWLTPKKPAPSPPPLPYGSYRLPTPVVPYHYDLALQPELANATFQGNVTIYVTCTSATDVITLHQDRLTIDPSFITITDVSNPATSFSVVNVTEEKRFHFYRIHLSQHLTEGQNYSLQILNFQGQMRTNGEGLYLSFYMDGSEKIWVAATQMEPTYARQAFPCFDEPALKATFNTTLLRRTDTGRNYFTLSNMPNISSYDVDGSWTADVYQQTMVMPTYLLAFVVCDFNYLSNVSSKYPVEIRTYAQPSRYQEGQVAQNYTVQLFDWFNSRFRPRYETYLSKLDNIALPYFSAGAMENWGLVTYKERLLYNSMSTLGDRIWVADVPAHEVTHMWFGNKVSPKWWTWTWLNEGFADYWQTYSVEQLFPSWKSSSVWDKAYNEFYTMDADSYRTSHPLNHPVEEPGAVLRQFGLIAYLKGGAIVGMMHMIMGEHFIPALNVYLDDHLMGNVDDKDLFNSLNKYIGTQADIDVNMTKVMDTWVNQIGYPLVNVQRQGNQLILTQQQFQLGSTSASDTEYKKFDIPITYTTSSERNFNKSRTTIVWMSADGSPLTINLTSPRDTWVVLNLRHEAYYRVNYDVTTWKALIAQLNTDHTVFDQINRAAFIDDAFNLVKAELLPLEIALQTLDYLKKEVDFAPWSVLQAVTRNMESLLDRTELYAGYQRFIQGLVDEPIRKMGFELPAGNDPPIEAEKMRLIITDACQYEYEPCLNKATSMVAAWMNNSDNNMINVNLRASFYCTAVREGDHAVWQFMYQRFLNETNARERTNLLTALGCSKDPAVLYAFLTTCLNHDTAPSRMTSSCVSAVAKNRYGRDVALNFVMEKFAYLLKKFPSVVGLITTVTSHFHSKFHLAQLQFLRESYVVSGLENTLDAIEQKTLVNMRWLDKNLDVIRRWLATH